MAIWIIWLIFAVVLMIIEIMTPAFLFGLFSVSAFFVAILSFFIPENYYWQIIIFAILSFIFVVFIRKFFLKYFIKKNKELKTNINSFIGKKYKLIEEINNDENKGAIVINGVRWHVISEDNSIIEKDSKIEIINIDGTKLIVKKVMDE